MQSPVPCGQKNSGRGEVFMRGVALAGDTAPCVGNPKLEAALFAVR
jgi:hypothetical protein